MGTSESISVAAKILINNPGKNIGVVSATSGTTDILIQLGNEALHNEDFEKTLQELRLKHENIIKGLNINLDISQYFDEIHDLLRGISLVKEISLSAKDKLMSFGERLSSEILAATLNIKKDQAIAVDAFNIIFTDNEFGNAAIDFEKTNIEINKFLKPHLEKGLIPIITGFIGQSDSGQYVTLGRGGSDYTSAIIASAVKADKLNIWTDVDGMFNADPRFFKNAKVLDKLSFEEASELAYFGAKVLHPKTIKPAVSANIPVRILNTFNTDAPGTVITKTSDESLKSVTYKKGISIINICSGGMLDAYGFLARVFDIFREGKVVVDVVATSEVSVSITVDNHDYKRVIQKLNEFATTNVYENMAIICLVGNGIQKDPNTLARLFKSVESQKISMISQGASQRNVTFVVEEESAKDTVEKIYNEFFNK